MKTPEFCQELLAIQAGGSVWDSEDVVLLEHYTAHPSLLWDVPNGAGWEELRGLQDSIWQSSANHVLLGIELNSTTYNV